MGAEKWSKNQSQSSCKSIINRRNERKKRILKYRKCTDKNVHVTNLQILMTSQAVVLLIGDTARGLCQCLADHPRISWIFGTVYLTSNNNEIVNTVNGIVNRV